MHITVYVTVMAVVARFRERYELVRRPSQSEAGISTLEVVVIALGLFILAGILVAALNAAVNSRISQIN